MSSKERVRLPMQAGPWVTSVLAGRTGKDVLGRRICLCEGIKLWSRLLEKWLEAQCSRALGWMGQDTKLSGKLKQMEENPHFKFPFRHFSETMIIWGVC